MENYMNKDVSICFWILTGKKGNGINYDKIKHKMIETYAIPSQMILAGTISAGRNLRSIITKLVV